MALPQPLHIFRKDLTHLWPETLFVLLLFVLFGYAAPSAWANSPYIIVISVLSLPIKILMVVSWLVLIARAIQDEPLVGDRQFWTSRPYHWASLLAAKAILIFTCIYVPFFLMQCYLLHHVGLNPTHAIPDLLRNLVLLTVCLVIPLAALSAVTSTFPRVLLSFIGAAILIAILFGFTIWETFMQMHPPDFWWRVSAVFIILPAVALIYQYKTRNTTIARIILAATPIVGVLFVFLTPNDSMIARRFPVASGPTLTSLSDKIPNHGIPPGELATTRDNVSIILPVAVAGIDKQVEYVADGVRVSISGQGVHYVSEFRATSFLTIPLIRFRQFSAGRAVAPLNFMVPVGIYNQIHDKPVDIHVEVAGEQFKQGQPSTWHATLLPFSVPGNGICTYPSDNTPRNQLNPGGNPVCRYALKQPDFLFLSAPLSVNACGQPAAAPVPGQASVGGGGAGATVDFDPVITVPLRFETGDPEPRHNYTLCPGTALTFVDVVPLQNGRLVLDQRGVILDPFAERYTPRSAGTPAAPAAPPQPE